LALAATVAAGLLEVGAVIGSARAGQSRAALAGDDPARALALADDALRWDPWQPDASRSRCASLKAIGRWTDLGRTAAAARRWHPDAYWFDLLQGEAAYMTGRSGDAAEALWRSFWIRSRPAHSPARLWRMAMLTGARRWGPRDDRVVAAAIRVIELLDADPGLSPAERELLRAEAAQALSDGGAPLTARVLRAGQPW
jgi:hypothetical protein